MSDRQSIENALAGAVLMVQARSLAANSETAASNAFQSRTTERGAAARAVREQEQLAHALQAAGVEVLMLEPVSASPDAVFPNNWFSTHRDGTLVLYPMEARSRRTEVMRDLPERLRAAGFGVRETVDLTDVRAGDRTDSRRCLEGTGSLVLDRDNRVAYVAPSSRTDLSLAAEWARRFGYETCVFRAADPSGKPVYHTNVILSLGPRIAVVCLAAVADDGERRQLVQRLEEGGRDIVAIDWDQVCDFAGNQLFLAGGEGPVVALSARADACLRIDQKRRIDANARRVVADIATIERHGGGSVRCMLAEIFLPKIGRKAALNGNRGG